jgi:hypothetical protein
MGLLAATSGRTGVTGLAATGIFIGIVAVGGHYLAVATDKGGRYLCKVVPDGAEEYDFTDAAPCDSIPGAVDEINLARFWNSEVDQAARPRWVPGDSLAFLPLSFERMADRYQRAWDSPDLLSDPALDYFLAENCVLSAPVARGGPRCPLMRGEAALRAALDGDQPYASCRRKPAKCGWIFTPAP